MEIEVAHPGSLPSDSGIEAWCYLGKDVILRSRLAHSLGETRRTSLGGRVNRVARETRDEFIAWVAAAGRTHADRINWWAMRLSSRSPLQTDLHLLVCFSLIFEELLCEFGDAREGRFLIVIEDPWLFKLLRDRHHGRAAVRFVSGTNLFYMRARSLARGFCARVILFFGVMRQTFLLKWRRLRRGRSNGVKASAWIYSSGTQLFADDGTLDDACMPHLGEILKRHNISYRYLVGLSHDRETARKIQISVDVASILDDADLSSLLKSFIGLPILCAIRSAVFRGHSLEKLLEREMWEELASANLCVNLLCYHLFRRFFKIHNADCLYFIYEGQPWEKMLCLARRDSANSVTLIGSQHSTIPFLYASYFPHPDEWMYLPRPDRVLTTGPFHRELLQNAGYPADMIVDAGSLRYPRVGARHAVPEKTNGEKLIYVALPVDPSISLEIVTLLLKYADDWIAADIEFLIKAHPDCPLSRIGQFSLNGRRLTETAQSMKRYHGRIEALLYSSGSSGLDALLQGIPVLAYVPEGSIDLDPALDWFPDCVIACDSVNFRDKVIHPIRTARSLGRLPEYEKIFGEVDGRRWLHADGASMGGVA